MPRKYSRAKARTKRDATGKRWPLATRTTLELRQKLERAAQTSGRSLVQEVELRLERSFAETDALAEFFGPPSAARSIAIRVALAFLNEGKAYAALIGVN